MDRKINMEPDMGLKDYIRGLQHIGMPVRNLEESMAFWSALGFSTTMRTDIENDGGVKVAMMELSGLVIELYEQTGALQEETCKRGDGHWDHVALDVSDIEAVYEKAVKAGLEVLEGQPVFLPFWERGVKFITVRGPNGEKVEFNQRL